jgi:hypothetical protein
VTTNWIAERGLPDYLEKGHEQANGRDGRT